MTQYLTKQKYEELVQEIKELKSTKRQEVADRLKAAKALGDLSENADYQEAREQQSTLERRIVDLEEVIRQAQIIEKEEGCDEVAVGCKVKLKKGSEEIEYTIVGSQEAKPLEGLISNQSPLGQILLGKKVGETVKNQTRAGEVKYKILSIE